MMLWIYIKIYKGTSLNTAPCATFQTIYKLSRLSLIRWSHLITSQSIACHACLMSNLQASDDDQRLRTGECAHPAATAPSLPSTSKEDIFRHIDRTIATGYLRMILSKKRRHGHKLISSSRNAPMRPRFVFVESHR